MSEVPTLHIDLDKQCSQCKRKGVAPNGLCLKCIIKTIPQILGKKQP